MSDKNPQDNVGGGMMTRLRFELLQRHSVFVRVNRQPMPCSRSQQLGPPLANSTRQNPAVTEEEEFNEAVANGLARAGVPPKPPDGQNPQVVIEDVEDREEEDIRNNEVSLGGSEDVEPQGRAGNNLKLVAAG